MKAKDSMTPILHGIPPSTQTPTLPCVIERGPEGFRLIDANGNGRMWCDGFGSYEAPFLLCAVNAHADLVAALDNLLHAIGSVDGIDLDAIDLAHVALAKATQSCCRIKYGARWKHLIPKDEE